MSSITNFNNKLSQWISSYRRIFLVVGGIISIRVFIEWGCFYFPIQLNVYQDYIRFYLENVFYFFILFLVVSLFVSRIISLDLKAVMRFGVKLYPLIWIPPLIDHFLLGRVEGYYYARVENFTSNLMTLYFATEDGSVGLCIEVIIGLVALFVYVLIKTKNIFKAFLTALFLHLFLAIFTTPDFFFGRGGADYYYDLFLPLYYFVPFFILVSACLFFINQSKWNAICKNLRLVRSLLFIVAVLLGVWARYIVNGTVYLFNPLLGCFSVFLLWQVSVIVNDVYDVSIDKVTNRNRPLVKGQVSVEDYQLLSTLFAFFALSFAAVINLKVLGLAIVFLMLAYAYSVPPLRFRNSFGGNIVIASAILLSFFIGILSSGYKGVNLFHVFPVGIMMFIFTMVLTLAKDIKDIEGDKKAGVINLFTVCGKEDAKKLMTVLIFLTLNISFLFFSHMVIILISAMAAYLYYRHENIIGVYLSGVIIIILLFLQLIKTVRFIP